MVLYRGSGSFEVRSKVRSGTQRFQIYRMNSVPSIYQQMSVLYTEEQVGYDTKMRNVASSFALWIRH